MEFTTTPEGLTCIHADPTWQYVRHPEHYLITSHEGLFEVGRCYEERDAQTIVAAGRLRLMIETLLAKYRTSTDLNVTEIWDTLHDALAVIEQTKPCQSFTPQPKGTAS